jgi:phosphoribosyl-ATP pyrophosphohydrolase
MYGAMVARRTDDPKHPRPRKLLQRGRPKIARKLGENVFETTIAAMAKDADSVVDESAKLLYMLLALWADCGVKPDEVWKKLQAARESSPASREDCGGWARIAPSPHPSAGTPSPKGEGGISEHR